MTYTLSSKCRSGSRHDYLFASAQAEKETRKGDVQKAEQRGARKIEEAGGVRGATHRHVAHRAHVGVSGRSDKLLADTKITYFHLEGNASEGHTAWARLGCPARAEEEGSLCTHLSFTVHEHIGRLNISVDRFQFRVEEVETTDDAGGDVDGDIVGDIDVDW